MEFGFRHAAAGSVGALMVLFLLYSLFLLTWRLHLLFFFSFVLCLGLNS